MHDLDVFLTLESIKTNYKQIFKAGGYNASMTLRIYNLLSSGKLMKSIYLPQFLLVMHPLIYGNWIEKNWWTGGRLWRIGKSRGQKNGRKESLYVTNENEA